MRICRFDSDRLGLIVGSDVVDVSEAIERLPAVRWPYPPGDPLIAHWNLIAPEIEKLAGTGERKPIASVRLLSPIASPTKIIGIARNRKNLSGETSDAEVVGQSRKDGDPCHMFIKANSAIAGPSDGVELRFLDRRTDPEVELSIVIGKKGTDISRERAFDHVFGYTIGLDMSLRGMREPELAQVDRYLRLARPVDRHTRRDLRSRQPGERPDGQRSASPEGQHARFCLRRAFDHRRTRPRSTRCILAT